VKKTAVALHYDKLRGRGPLGAQKSAPNPFQNTFLKRHCARNDEFPAQMESLLTKLMSTSGRSVRYCDIPKASSFVPINEWAYGDRSTLDAGDRRAVAERGQIDPPTNKLKTILRHGT
jgi:hypothetical protein